MSSYLPEDDATSFDDVAMILLIFFLVLIFFIGAKTYMRRELDARTGKPRATKSAVKTHGDLDLAIYVDAEGSIHLYNLGGVFPDPKHLVAPPGTAEGSPPFAETRAGAAALATELEAYAERVIARAGAQPVKVRVFQVAHPDARYAGLYSLWREFGGFRDRLASAKLEALPVACPPLESTAVIEALGALNGCLGAGGKMEGCLREAAKKVPDAKKVSRTGLASRFCNWKAFQESQGG